MQEPSKNLMCIDGVFKSVDDTTKHDHAPRVSNLQQQLHFEERNCKQEESKLLSTKLDCQECEKNLIACESTYNKYLRNQIMLNKL
jgi:hypothetical protein